MKQFFDLGLGGRSPVAELELISAEAEVGTTRSDSNEGAGWGLPQAGSTTENEINSPMAIV